MIELLKAALLGLVQGVSEFLPISSTGHLILLEKLLGISQDTYGLAFDAALHLGTLVSIVWFFQKDWLLIFQSTITLVKRRRLTSDSERLAAYLLIGTIPAVIAGLLLENAVENAFRSPLLVGIMLAVFCLPLWYVEKTGKKNRTIGKLQLSDALIIGGAQVIALIPGVSRSGITIAAGMLIGLQRAEAARFAFLLSGPIVAGAGGLQLVKTLALFMESGLTIQELLFFITGIISAAIFGYLTIKYFLEFISKRSLYPFIIYRIVLALIILALHVL